MPCRSIICMVSIGVTTIATVGFGEIHPDVSTVKFTTVKYLDCLLGFLGYHHFHETESF